MKYDHTAKHEDFIMGNKRFPEIMNKTIASIYLFGRIDIDALNKLMEDERYTVGAVFMPGKRDIVVLKKDLDKTIEELSSQKHQPLESILRAG